MVVNFGTNVVVSAKIYNMPKGQKEDYGKEPGGYNYDNARVYKPAASAYEQRNNGSGGL